MKEPRFKPPSFARILKESEATALRDYPSLLGIKHCISRVYAQGADALVSTYWRGWTRQFWFTDNVDYVTHGNECGDGNVSGSTCLIEKDNDVKVVVFLRKDLSQRPTLQAGVLFATLAHELGHVDDIVKGINLVSSKPVDLVAAEEYAHHFACSYIMNEARRADRFGIGLSERHLVEWRKVFAEMFRPVMAFYIGEMLPKLKVLPVPSISTAAARVLESSHFHSYRQFAGSYLDA